MGVFTITRAGEHGIMTDISGVLNIWFIYWPKMGMELVLDAGCAGGCDIVGGV